MPPANTPARTPTRPQTPAHQRPLTPLSYLSSPVPDLASTLHTHVADEADDANVSFLRNSLDALDRVAPAPPRPHTHVDPQRDPRRLTNYSRSENAGGDGGGAGERTRIARAGNRIGDSSSQSSGLANQETAEDLSRRDRLQRVLARLNRLHDASAPSTTAYTDRTPSPHRQSLYDWAPSAFEEAAANEDVEMDPAQTETRQMQSETDPDILRLLGLYPNEQDPRRRMREDGAMPSSNSMEAQERRDRLRLREIRRRRENDPGNLRNLALWQRARQEGLGSPSARERMLRYVMVRERSGLSEEEARAREQGWFPEEGSGVSTGENGNSNNPRRTWLLPPPADDLRQRDQQERVEAFRRGYLASNVPPRVPLGSSTNHSTSMLLERSLKYLSALRTCDRYDDVLNNALHYGLTSFLSESQNDFAVDVQDFDPIPFSSWLQPGSVFEGSQHATTNNANLTHQRPRSSSHIVEQINPNWHTSAARTSPPTTTSPTHAAPFEGIRTWRPRDPSATTTATSLSSHPTVKLPDISHNRWPVRVTIHAIDAEKMTLQGTMEAYDVPQHPSSFSIRNCTSPPSSDFPKAGEKTDPITTYLEGHIIDLRTHSFLTPRQETLRKQPDPTTSPNSIPPSTTIIFPAATARTDASNWRKLPPFNTLPTDENLASTLLSPTSMSHIHDEYIFMRWKERCFVHGRHDACTQSSSSSAASRGLDDRDSDQHRGHGLTISGFYYVSLRRADGAIEGLYFDPASTPYQHLRLGGLRGGWPSVQFR